jgi:hypothetical protein
MTEPAALRNGSPWDGRPAEPAGWVSTVALLPCYASKATMLSSGSGGGA